MDIRDNTLRDVVYLYSHNHTHTRTHSHTCSPAVRLGSEDIEASSSLPARLDMCGLVARCHAELTNNGGTRPRPLRAIPVLISYELQLRVGVVCLLLATTTCCGALLLASPVCLVVHDFCSSLNSGSSCPLPSSILPPASCTITPAADLDHLLRINYAAVTSPRIIIPLFRGMQSLLPLSSIIPACILGKLYFPPPLGLSLELPPASGTRERSEPLWAWCWPMPAGRGRCPRK